MKKLYVIVVLVFCTSVSNFCQGQTFAGFTYDSLSSGMSSPGACVLALAMKDSGYFSSVYAGGHFKIAGRKTAVNIAEWVDTIHSYPAYNGEWFNLGSGVDSDVCALVTFNKKLYAGGKFDTAGGIACNHIARWDTTSHIWDSLIGKLNGNVYSLCVYHNALYVGGDFTIINGDTVNRIAKWNDTAWTAVGKGFDTGAVYALTVSNDTLYAGGSFIKSNGTLVNHIAKLLDTSWGAVKGGTNNTVYALAEYNYTLYVGGAFTMSDGIPTRYISYYDNYFSNSWGDLQPGTNDTVRALNNGNGLFAVTIKKGTGQGLGGGYILLVGGNFDSAGGYSSHYIAGLYMNQWDTVGELDGPVFALSNPYQGADENYVGGKFSVARNGTFKDTVNNVAYLSIFLGGGIETLSDKFSIVVYPNPSNGMFTFETKSEELKGKRIEVYNVLGEKIYNALLTTFNSQFNVDLSSNPNGIYLYRVVGVNGELIGEGKLVIQK